eukprot:SAG11_NODE_44_length_20765_cov_5.183635_5_plen_89_part_00
MNGRRALVLTKRIAHPGTPLASSRLTHDECRLGSPRQGLRWARYTSLPSAAAAAATLRHAPCIKQAHPRRMSAGFTATGLALGALKYL